MCDRIYRELVLESHAERRMSRKIFFFHKIINGISPVYVQPYISYCGEGVYQTRSANQKNFRQFSTRTKIFIWVILFFLIVLMKIESTVQFKTKILSFIRPKENWVFKIPEINGIKLLSRIRLYFSHLNEHKCWHNFIATIDPMCRCGLEPKQHSVTSYIRIFTQTLEQSFLMIFVL